jgi:GntR family transcriptional regulator
MRMLVAMDDFCHEKSFDSALLLCILSMSSMNAAFSISQTDKRPMYLQIMGQIKQRIAVGDWEEGHPIPSIRQLAVDLRVSVITVKRAYLELEREGVIVTQQGKGSHVASTPGLGARLREQELGQHLEQAARIAAQLGIRGRELEHRLREAGDRISEKEIL